MLVVEASASRVELNQLVTHGRGVRSVVAVLKGCVR